MRSGARLASISVLSATLLTLAVLGAGGGMAAGRAAPHVVLRGGLTQPVFSYKHAIRETVYVQSPVDGDRDGRKDLLATDIVRPRASDEGMRVPTIYEMSPYYQTLGRGNESETKQPEDGDWVPQFTPLFYDNYFVPRGYAFIAQDMPGTRNSEGCMVLGGRQELIAARATISWLRGGGAAYSYKGGFHRVYATWSAGRVGMIGKSYDGSIANGAASFGIPGLRTIVPIAGISRWYDYHLDNGVQYPNAYSTPELFVFLIDQQPADDEERGAEWVQATFGENGPCTQRALAISAKAGDPQANYTQFWKRRDYLKDVRKVHASVFVVHGLNDQNVMPNHFVQWWSALARRGVPRKIWLAQTGHVDPFDFRRPAWVPTLHRWFDRWLYGIRNGIMQQPRATIERSPQRWVDYSNWPSPRAKRVALALKPPGKRSPGRLGFRLAARTAKRSFSDDPNQTESDMASDPGSSKDHRLLFLTGKLLRKVRISGRMRVVLRASADRADTNLTALLVDYPPGKEQIRRVAYDNGSEGVTTLDKESCWGRSTAQDDGCYHKVAQVMRRVPFEVVTRGWLDARHHMTLRRNTPLVPGKTYSFHWRPMGDDYIFPRGHRIGLVIAASDASFTIPDQNGATITVTMRGSRLVLPVVGGRAALRLSSR